MRRLRHVGALGMIACSLSVVAAAPAARTLRPPVIHEPWTPLPCPSAKPQTTLAFEGCLERALSRSDRTIDRIVARIFQSIERRRSRSTFVSGERSWLSYRRRSCRATASRYRGGTIEPVIFLRCEQRLNGQHIVDLEGDEKTLKSP